jgi:hypothetical protein
MIVGGRVGNTETERSRGRIVADPEKRMVKVSDIAIVYRWSMDVGGKTFSI